MPRGASIQTHLEGVDRMPDKGPGSKGGAKKPKGGKASTAKSGAKK